jgi:hypothetical protein
MLNLPKMPSRGFHLLNLLDLLAKGETEVTAMLVQTAPAVTIQGGDLGEILGLVAQNQMITYSFATCQT